MIVETTPLEGLIRFTPQCHKDPRGFFMETWRDEWYTTLGIKTPFIQDNYARSEEKGVLRGLHFQAPPCAQSKLIWVIRGAILDVVVDVRKNSLTYGKWYNAELSAANQVRLYVPQGFAHGYLTLQQGTEVQYKVDNYYSPAHEGGIFWNDPELAIPWDIQHPILSQKDTELPILSDFDSPFE